ncbi:MAG: DUF2812 domain-containing protein [bacterium]|nr:DUF2812 domain-containing protein [bacterium]
MREKDKRVAYCSVHLQHLDRVEEFLNKMASEGWFVYKYIGSLFYFKKGTPKEIQYYAEVFEKEKWNNSSENTKNKGFIEKCKQEGWTFVYANSRFQVLSTDRINSKKPKMKEETVVESIFKSYYKEYFYLLICLIFMACCNVFTEFMGIVHILTSFSQFIYVVAWIALALFLLAYILVNRKWHSKVRIAAKLKQQLPENPRGRMAYVGLSIIVIMLLISIIGFFVESRTFHSKGAFTRCLVLFVLAGLVLLNQLVRRKKKGNYLLQILGSIGVCAIAIIIYAIAYNCSSIFVDVHKKSQFAYEVNGKSGEINRYEDEIPFDLEDFGITTNSKTEYSKYHQVDGEFVIKKDYYSDEPTLITVDDTKSSEPCLYYIVYKTKSKYLYNRILKDECYNGVEDYTYDIIENNNLKAKKVYVKKIDDKFYEYIFLYDNVIVEVNINSKLTEKQLEKVGDFEY